MRLDGFGLLVEDMAKMIRFYRDVRNKGGTAHMRPLPNE